MGRKASLSALRPREGRQMKQRGATILAQDEASCVVFGMPREPVEEGIADAVVSLDGIAEEITRLVGKGATACK